MKVLDVPQRSPEWFKARLGVFTASETGKWIAKGSLTATDLKARDNLICRKLAEVSGCEMAPVFENWAMKRGSELEPEAREYYSQESGNEVEEVGFCIHDSGSFGCSPDGFVQNRKGMLEIKSPEPQTHCRYLLEGGFPETYEVQVHHQMAVTGAEFCDFYSYCPGLPSLLVKVERDEYTEAVLRGLIALSEKYSDYKRVMAQLWDEMKQRQESLKEGKAA